MYNLHLQLHSQASWSHLNILRIIVLEAMVSLCFTSTCAHRSMPAMSMILPSPSVLWKFGSTLDPLLGRGIHAQTTSMTHAILLGGFMSLDFLVQETWG